MRYLQVKTIVESQLTKQSILASKVKIIYNSMTTTTGKPSNTEHHLELGLQSPLMNAIQHRKITPFRKTK